MPQAGARDGSAGNRLTRQGLAGGGVGIGAVFDHTTQQIAAVSRAPGNLDLFVIGFDNRAWSEPWNDHVGWN
ncbi:hypothetical protein [Actinomadura sp. NPDC000600]|uniref:hypothetical protein n=1 Tax=Actinomadura sp. NPDC000600 TaxID=3154262 RepID=UPI003399BC43